MRHRCRLGSLVGSLGRVYSRGRPLVAAPHAVARLRQAHQRLSALLEQRLHGRQLGRDDLHPIGAAGAAVAGGDAHKQCPRWDVQRACSAGSQSARTGAVGFATPARSCACDAPPRNVDDTRCCTAGTARASERARPHRPRIAHARARMRARRSAIRLLAALRERGCVVVDGGARLSALRDHLRGVNGCKRPRCAGNARAHVSSTQAHARAHQAPAHGHTGEAERAAPAHPDAAQGLARPTLAHAPQPAGVPHASGLTASRRAARCLRQSEGDQHGRAVHMPSHGHSGTDSRGTAAARN